MTYKTTLLSIAVLILTSGCSNSKQFGPKNSSKPESQSEINVVDSNVVKVYVDQNGNITADGISISLNDLDSKLSALKQSNGVVYYSRDNSLGDPHPDAMKVIRLIINYGLPTKLFTDKTYTIVVTDE